MKRQTATVRALVDAISPFLAGHAPEVQSAVLADLVALWLAGHHSTDGTTEALREELLNAHVALVRRLIPIDEQIILKRLKKH